MADVFSPARQARVWRDLWIALAETERELGVDVPEEAIEAMRAARDEVDLTRVAELEADLRHDVMAHVHHFGELAPAARAYIHLGATSCFVTDNAGLIQLRQGLELVRSRVIAAIAALADFAERWKELPTLGYTHWQPAQPTTVGKRATLWLHDLLLDLRPGRCRPRRAALPWGPGHHRYRGLVPRAAGFRGESRRLERPPRRAFRLRGHL